MALLNTTKLVYGALGASAIGGFGAGAYYYLSNSNSKETNSSRTISIATKLSEEKYELLDGESGEWTNILNAYKSNTKLHFEGFDGKTIGEGAVTKLKELCNEAIKLDTSKDTNNATYEKTKKWCTKPRTLTELLAHKGHTMLDTATEGDPQKDLWQARFDAHQSETVVTEKKFSNLEVLTGSEPKKDETNRSKLREKCRGLKDQNRKHYEQEFEKELEQTMLWCSTKNQ